MNGCEYVTGSAVRWGRLGNLNSVVLYVCTYICGLCGSRYVDSRFNLGFRRNNNNTQCLENWAVRGEWNASITKFSLIHGGNVKCCLFFN